MSFRLLFSERQRPDLASKSAIRFKIRAFGSPILPRKATPASLRPSGIEKMPIMVAALVSGVGRCAAALGELRDRWAMAVFEAVGAVARYTVMGLVFCFYSFQRRSDLAVPFI